MRFCNEVEAALVSDAKFVSEIGFEIEKNPVGDNLKLAFFGISDGVLGILTQFS
jgi:hypothetical protein